MTDHEAPPGEPSTPGADLGTHRADPERGDPAGGRAGLLVVISGPSGVGKTTLVRAVEADLIPDVAFSVSVTTRDPTPKDRPGIDYDFIDDAAFDAMVARGELLEWAGVFGRRYGTPRAPVDRHLDAGRVVLLEIDVRGAVQVRSAMPGALLIFVLPPDERTLLDRLRARGREDEASIQRRFAEATREIGEARSSGAYDRFVVNDDLDRARAEMIEAIRHRRTTGAPRS